MTEVKIKACPLLGCSYATSPSVLRGYPPIISAHLIPCVGEDCINFRWDCDDGYCRYFEKYTNHDRRKSGEAE